jgi:hypothetical protein
VQPAANPTTRVPVWSLLRLKPDQLDDAAEIGGSFERRGPVDKDAGALAFEDAGGAGGEFSATTWRRCGATNSLALTDTP